MTAQLRTRSEERPNPWTPATDEEPEAPAPEAEVPAPPGEVTPAPEQDAPAEPEAAPAEDEEEAEPALPAG